MIESTTWADRAHNIAIVSGLWSAQKKEVKTVGIGGLWAGRAGNFSHIGKWRLNRYHISTRRFSIKNIATNVVMIFINFFAILLFNFSKFSLAGLHHITGFYIDIIFPITDFGMV